MAKVGKILYKCNVENGDIYFIQAENSVKVFDNIFGNVSCCGDISIQKYNELMAKKDKKERNEIIERRFGYYGR